MATLIVKCTERCNAECAYCEVVRTHAGVPDMTDETLALVFRRIGEYLAAKPGDSVNFTWHGGEPLLLGADYFRRARELQEEFCPGAGHRIGHCIQSNLTLLTDRHLEALRLLGINHLGTSFDPEPGIRGIAGRKNSTAYNRAFFRAAGLIERHGLNWGYIYVVTKKSLADPAGVFHRLANLKPGQGFMMNPVLVADDPTGELAITPIEYADFIGAVFPLWHAHRERYGRVEPFASLYAYVIEGRRELFCSESGFCGRTHLNIDPRGDVSKCGRSSDLGIMSFGNLRDASLDECLEQSKALLDGRGAALRAGDCAGCRLWAICHGGCPLDAFTASGRFDAKTGWCEAKRRFVFEYFEPVTGARVDLPDD
jgi:radical SAM protein with 4Fe4S-binding SPASM domain